MLQGCLREKSHSRDSPPLLPALRLACRSREVAGLGKSERRGIGDKTREVREGKSWQDPSKKLALNLNGVC